MKRKDLYNYIREEIINELSETTYAGKGAVEKIKQDPKFGTLNTSAKANAISDLNKGGDVELEEMARPVTAIKIQDKTKLELAKEIYSQGKMAQMIKAIEDAGADGVTQKQLGVILGIKNDSDLNPFINTLVATGAIGRPKAEKPTAEPEVEKPETMEPEDIFGTEEPEDIYGTEEEPEDTYYKGDEEETPEEEPTVSKADTGLAADIEKLTQLQNKLKSIMSKYKDASGKIPASSIENYKKEVGTLPQEIKALKDKLEV